jgi:hypothetical protein
VIRLVALDQDTQTQTTLDLEGSPSISLNLAVAKPGETMQRHAPYSQTFRLPFSPSNNQFFAHFYEVTLSDGDFDPTQKTEVLIFEDGVQVIRGAMQLRAVRLMAQVYEVNVLGDVADLFAEMGSKLLEAVFRESTNPTSYTTDYNYPSTTTSFIQSQTLTNQICSGDNVPDGTVVIPLADHGLRADGQPLAAQPGYGLMDSAALQTGLFPEMLKPAFKLRVLFQLILEQAGFYYTSTFINSAFFGSIYMTLGDESEELVTTNANRCKAIIAADITFPILNNGVGIIPYDTDDGSQLQGSFDEDDNFNTTTHTYICPIGGNYTFRATVFMENIASNAGACIIRIMKGNVSLASEEYELAAVAQTGSSHTFNLEAETVVPINAAIQVQILTPELVVDPKIFSATFETIAAPGGQVLVPQMMPRIKQKDFVRDLCQRFNLVIVADPDNPKRLYIEPYRDWIGDGVDAYWTDKLDLDKERSLMPTSSLKSSRIFFQDKESGDVGNQDMAARLGMGFGTYDQDIDDDFSTGELKNEPVFSPFFVYPVPNLQGDPNTYLSTLLVHRSYQLDGVGVKPVTQSPKLCFATGLQTIGDTLYIDGTSFTSIQFMSPYSSSSADGDDQSLFWNSTDRPFSFGNQTLINQSSANLIPLGLHRTYWASYLADIYDADARVFEAHLYLTPSDIRNVRFNDRFHILGATYKLTEISGYQIGTGESTLCKFLRDLERSSFGACSSVPTSSNANGTVTFTDADGTTTVNPGQQCCEAFGYYYDAESNTCRWNNTGNGNPGSVPDTPTDATDPIPDYNGDGPGPVSPFGMNVVTTDTGSGTRSVFSTFTLSAETYDATPTTATAELGTTITVNADTIATGLMRVNTTTVGGTSGTAFDSSFETWRFLANGRAGTVSFSKTSGTTLTSGSPGTRNPSATISGGVLTFQVTGLANTIINWSLDVEMLRMYATNESEFQDALLTEAGARIAGINDRVIIKE